MLCNARNRYATQNTLNDTNGHDTRRGELVFRRALKNPQPTTETPKRSPSSTNAVAAVASGTFRDLQPPAIKGSGYVVKCLEAALWAFHGAPDFREAVLRAVNLGDDADTTGAVCGQLAGAIWGESGIPHAWLSGLARQDMIEKARDGIAAH